MFEDDDLMEDGVWDVVFGGGVVEVEMGCVVFVVGAFLIYDSFMIHGSFFFSDL